MGLDEDESQIMKPIAEAILAPPNKIKLSGASVGEQSATKSNRGQSKNQGQITAERPAVETDLV